MITYVVTDLLQSPARVLVNAVNTVGVMGKGIAKDFKQIYPEMFKEYQLLCERKQFNIGQLWLYKTPYKWVLNFPTKQHWKHPSKIEYIEEGLKKFVKTYSEKGLTSISFPLLGCGNGGLDWETQVKPLMEQYLSKLPIDIFIHLYRKDPFQAEHRNIKEIKKWLRSQAESLAFSEVWEDIKNILLVKQDFITLDTHDSFKASIINSEEVNGVRIETEVSDLIYDYQLLDFWQYLRGFGFSMTNNMPCGLENYASYIVAILAELPYVKPVMLSREDVFMQKMDIGLQLIPRSDYIKEGFFTTSVEVNAYE